MLIPASVWRDHGCRSGWRRAILYSRTGVNLADAGLVPAGEEEATLEFTVPRDPAYAA
ncbi:hypothetical protein Vqi01_53050 [Micromonospora qiuiae]|uniref:Uncharacterized protein n=1 Tax=Micromonospora qiuiae TaxID=502268 RepID=A0ABQ4JHQ6_9ACTN|nr:hypothetical protein Vqi01_53050 [Micromonospora qiuiae]